MEDSKNNKVFHIDQRKLSIIVFSLFFSWLLAFPFEGQALYAITERFNIDPQSMIFSSIAAHFAGLISGGFFIKTMKATKKWMSFSIIFCMIGSLPFFFHASILWNISLLLSSFMAGTCVAAWGFYFKAFTPPKERMKTAADVLIYSNILMIIINVTAVNISPYAALCLSLIFLGGALLSALRLPENLQVGEHICIAEMNKSVSFIKPLAFLCFFIVIITINSGLMYQVINPAFEHHQLLVSWYWAVPYIIALYSVKNLPYRVNRNYILYVAIAMMGLSFIAFMMFDRSAGSYLMIDTLMLAACGIYDLFWWSILGEMLDYSANPAKILGIGLSANVLGVLIGGILGNQITSGNTLSYNPSVIALIIVFIILIVLPILHKYLLKLLENHIFLTALYEIEPSKKKAAIDNIAMIDKLTGREREIAALLLQGRTYKMIANELFLSENTIKTHIKNIYSKFNIQSKTELITLLMKKEHFIDQ